MARVVLGLACSRSPLLSMPPGLWSLMGERDQRSSRLRDKTGKLVSYQELLAQVDPSMASELTAEAWQKKYDASQRALATLADKLADVDPELVVAMGDDEEEYIHEDNRPAILIYRGQTFRNVPRSISAATDPVTRASAWAWGEEEADYPVASDLCRHVVEYLTEKEFDVSDSTKLEAMAHGFGFTYRRIMTRRVVPIVPVIVNVHTPPNQPTPRRCYLLGRAIREALESWDGDARVAVIGTGGLSVGVLDEELDRRALAAMQARDVASLSTLPRPWMQGPTGEILNWIGTAGVAEHLRMEVLEYIPAYRSPAGTGSGLGFAMWT